jgi:hypothetical protein
MKDLLSKLNIKKITSLFKKDQVYHKHYLSPKKDWFYIVLFFCTGSLLFAFLGLLIYTKIDSGDFWKPDKNISVKIYKLNSANLKKVVDVFDKKAIDFQQIESGGVDIKSPFL